MKNKSRTTSNNNSPQQQKELQDIFENALECVARLDVSGSFLSVNSNFSQTYAYQAEEMVGMPSKDTVHAEDATIFEEAYQQMRQQGRAEIDVRGIRKDSSVFYKHVVMVKGLSDDKSAIGHYCFIQDITERILNQQALRDQAKLQSEQLHSLIENIQGVVYRCNTIDWQFEYLDKNISEMLGISKNEIPKDARTLFVKYTHKQDVKKLAEIIKLKIPESGKYEIEYRIVCKDGSIKWLQNRATGVFNDEQKLTHIDGVLLDITRQKQVEHELNASELLLTTAIETSPTVMCISRIDDGKILKVNRSFESTFGYTREEILDTSAIDLWPEPKERDKLVKALKEKGKLDNFECSLRHKDGHIATALLSAHIIEVDGEPCIFSAGHDISERIRIETALRKSEERYANAINLNPDAICLTRMSDGLIFDVNEGFSKTTGYTRKEVIGKNTTDLGLWYDNEDRDEFVRQLKKFGKVQNLEIKYRKKNENFSVVLLSSAVVDVDGESSIFTIAHDIGERIKFEQKLRASEEKFSTAINVSPDAIITSRVSDGEILNANEGLERITGYTQEEVIGKTTRELFWINDKQRKCFVKELREKGKVNQFEAEFRRKDGSSFPCVFSSVLFNQDDDQFTLTIAHDISELKQVTRHLKRTNRALHVLNECNYGLTHILDEQELLQYICKVIINTGGYRFAWVGYAQNDKRKTVRPMANAGYEAKYLDNVILWSDKQRGRGLTGSCIRTGSPQICRNISKDPALKPWRKAALAMGYQSSVALPLIIEPETIGALIIYSSETEVFDADEVKLLSNLAENLAFGIHSTRLKEERRLAEIILRNSEEKFRSTFGNAPAGMLMINSDGVVLEANKAALMLSGLTEQEMVGSSIADITHPDDLEISMKYFKDLWSGKIDSYQIEKRYQHKDGHTIHSILHGSLVHDENDNPLFMVGQAEDITAKKHLNDVLTASEAKYKMLYHDTPAMFFNVNNSGTILSVNNYGAKQLGYTVDELIGVDVYSLIHEEDKNLAKDYITNCIESPEQVHRWEIRKRKKDGDVIWVRESVRVVSDYGDETTFFIVCEDITETYRLSQQLSYQATHDSLTGLVNRSEFERRLQRVLKIDAPKNIEHAICYLDLDQFKIINDTCGHLAGDELLRQLSELLLAKVRKRDTLARLGGDEFGVLMEHCDLEQARRVADSLRETVEKFRFVWQDKKFSIGVSIGLVPINTSSGNVNDILSAADAACYAAKDAGRNRIHVYASDDKSVAMRRGEMQWVNRINHALEEGLFKLYYQKIVSVNGLKQGDHYELLLRMTGSNGELIPPGAFLSAAERYGLSNKIDSWVVNKAFTWLASHPAKLKKLHICAINLSGQSLGNEEFMQGLLNSLDESGIPANKICFEITETAAIANLASAIRFINKFRSKGCLFALDDFGSGVSSFGYLKNLPVDYLKIDGSFVRDIANDRIDRAMVKSINEIGQIMGKQTIAEFVENDAILKELKKLGVDYAQGYGIGKPRPLYYSKKKVG